VLEYAHFAVGFPQLIKVAVPDYAITCVFEELSVLTKKVFPSLSQTVKEYSPLILLRDVLTFSTNWQNEILPIISKALGTNVEGDCYAKIAEDAQRLLTMYYFFRDISGPVPATDQKIPGTLVMWFGTASFGCRSRFLTVLNSG